MLLIFFFKGYHFIGGTKITQMPKATLDSYPSSMEPVLSVFGAELHFAIH